MITIQVLQGKNLQDITSKVQQPLTLSFRLDRELDSGNFTTFVENNSTDKIIAPLTKHQIIIADGTGNTLQGDYIGTDQRAMLRNKADNGNLTALFRHSVNITEATKLLEGVLIDGLGVTQPNTGTQKNLLEVTQRLLRQTKKQQTATSVGIGTFGTGYFSLIDDTNLTELLANTESPQFRWSPQTTLWECLCDIGSVIDAIPYLEYDALNELRNVGFLVLNDETATITDLIDEYTYSYGEEVNEQQYNSRLTAIVENIKEV